MELWVVVLTWEVLDCRIGYDCFVAKERAALLPCAVAAVAAVVAAAAVPVVDELEPGHEHGLGLGLGLQLAPEQPLLVDC